MVVTINLDRRYRNSSRFPDLLSVVDSDKIVLNLFHTGLVRILPLVCLRMKQKLFNINYNTNRPSHTLPCELKSQQLNMNSTSISNLKDRKEQVLQTTLMQE